jgi:hypothetical protein
LGRIIKRFLHLPENDHIYFVITGRMLIGIMGQESDDMIAADLQEYVKISEFELPEGSLKKMCEEVLQTTNGTSNGCPKH